jgi:glutathione-regulated potassium-efflux system ancillary protein KefG
MSRLKTVVNLFHPNLAQSRANNILSQALRSTDSVLFRDLYALYPDGKIDVKGEQKVLLDHDLIVFQHPFYWYSSPALFKEWQDRVLEQGFAFPPGVGDKLKGKKWWTVLTTGGAEEAYRSGGFNNYTVSELLRPFQQTANLCGMQWLPPFVVHSVLPPGIAGFTSITDSDLRDKAMQLKERLALQMNG